MNLPTIPSDNIYKFLCFTGLTMIVVSYIYINSYSEKLHEKTFELKVQIKITDSNKPILDHMLTTLERKTEVLLLEIEEAKYFELLNDHLSYLKEYQKFKIEDIRQVHELENIDFLIENYRSLKIRHIIILFVGIFLIGFGGYYWYFRVQKYTDEKLKNEAKKK